MMLGKLEDFLSERHDLSERTKTQYRMAFQALAKYVDDPFSLDKQQMTDALNLMSRDYADGSWNSYVMCIRVWYKWANGDEYPEAVGKIRFKRVRREDYVKTKILSDDEIKALLRACDHPRDKAFLAVLAATGARRGEMLNLRIRDVEWRPYGYDLVLTGKTGTHPSPPVVRDYAKILRVWLEHHPQRNNPDAPLWVRRKGDRVEGIKRVSAHNIVKEAAKAAKLERNIHMHMFRHTENTLLTKRHVPAAARKKLHGWSPTSNTPSIYEHLTDDDAVKAALRGHGIVRVEEATDSFEPVECGYCHESNPSENKFCHFCGLPLSGEAAEEQIARQKRLESAYKFLADPKVQDALLRLAEEKK